MLLTQVLGPHSHGVGRPGPCLSPSRTHAACHPKQKVHPNYVIIELIAIGNSEQAAGYRTGQGEGATWPCTRCSQMEPFTPAVCLPSPACENGEQRAGLCPLLLTLGLNGAPVNSILEPPVCEIKFLLPKVRAPIKDRNLPAMTVVLLARLWSLQHTLACV